MPSTMPAGGRVSPAGCHHAVDQGVEVEPWLDPAGTVFEPRRSAGIRTAVADTRHDIAWDLRHVARVAARNPDDNPPTTWGNGRVIRHTRRMVAEWCASHVGPVEVIESEGIRVLRFSNATDQLVFRLRWM